MKVKPSISISRIEATHGGSRPGAGRPQTRARTTDLPSISVLWFYRRDAAFPREGSVIVKLDHHHEVVQIYRAAGLVGQTRPLFVCPECQAGAEVLYLHTESCLTVQIAGHSLLVAAERKSLACRRCLRLQYPSQSEGKVSRSYRRQKRTLKNFDTQSALKKPKWMRWRVFERMVEFLARERSLRLGLRDGRKSAGKRTDTALYPDQPVAQIRDKDLLREFRRQLRASPLRRILEAKSSALNRA